MKLTTVPKTLENGASVLAISKRMSANLRQSVRLQPKLSEVNASDQPISVWENEGGAIVLNVRRTLVNV